MKLIHLSDLHLGKRLNEFSLLEDQRFILSRIMQVIDAEQPQAVIIAGDIYDKSVPSAEAVQLFDDFLVWLSRRELEVFLISGNHDSEERIAFGGRLMERSGIHVAPVYNGKVSPICLKDAYGVVSFYLLPFLKPANVRRFFEEEQIVTYTDAVRTAIAHMNADPSVRNVLVTHQFVTGAACCGSEELSVGGSDNVDAEVFSCFDYTALGHIHGAQSVGRAGVRYCGTPLKYSFSECKQEKSVTVAELGEKGQLAIRTVPLHPKHEMRELRGSYDELTLKANYENTDTEDYVRITLTDEEDVPDAVGRLRTIYPNLMRLDYDNTRTRSTKAADVAAKIEQKTELELFAEFFEMQNGQPMSEEQLRYVKEAFEQLGEEEV